MKLELISLDPEERTHDTPLLFVHGMWHGAWCWQEHFMPYFASHGYQVHALSLRGHGGSEGRKKLRWNRLSGYVADVAQTVGELDHPPVLVGHSMGGAVVQKFLEGREMAGAILLASVPPKGLLGATFRVARRYPWPFLKANLTLSMMPIIATYERCREMFFSRELPQESARRYFERMQDESYMAYVDMLGLNLPRPKRVTTPLLVLGAAEDRAIVPAEVEATARAYGTEAVIFPAMAHDMMLEPGWQEVAGTMLAWLADRT